MKIKSTIAVLFVAGLSLNACSWSKKKNSSPKGAGETKVEQKDEIDGSKKGDEDTRVEGQDKVTVLSREEVEGQGGEVVMCSEATLAQIRSIAASHTEFAGQLEICRGDHGALESLLDRLTSESILVTDFENEHGTGVCYEYGSKDGTLIERNLEAITRRFRKQINTITSRINQYLAEELQNQQGQSDLEQGHNSPNLPY